MTGTLMSGLARRPVPRSRRPRKSPAERVTVFHGTSLDRGAAIAKHGLRPSILKDGPWVTLDREKARGYVMRAVVAELDQQGRLHDPRPAIGLIVVLREVDLDERVIGAERLRDAAERAVEENAIVSAIFEGATTPKMWSARIWPAGVRWVRRVHEQPMPGQRGQFTQPVSWRHTRATPSDHFDAAAKWAREEPDNTNALLMLGQEARGRRNVKLAAACYAKVAVCIGDKDLAFTGCETQRAEREAGDDHDH